MTIRPATEQDLPQIMQLSKESLGEVEGMRTIEYWRWKHIHNPFGASPVLLAFEEDTLIGLRAFMRWRFRYAGKIMEAYRAVDTATHPDHRGKGIFTRLTLTLIDQLRAGEPAIIFNTPNSKSLPGYIKMGWKTVGKTHLVTRIFPWHVVRNRLSRPAWEEKGSPVQFPEDMAFILKEWMASQQEALNTDYSPDYLRWRYQRIPVLNYQVHVARENGAVCVIVYRRKASGRINELRLTEVFYTGDGAAQAVRKALRELADIHQPDVMTVLADPGGRLSAMLPMGFMKSERYGLTITCRKVNDDALEALALNHSLWGPSAGTLELF